MSGVIAALVRTIQAPVANIVADPPFAVGIFGTESFPASGSTDGNVVVTVINGTGPFTYLWEYVSGATNVYAIVNGAPNNANFFTTVYDETPVNSVMRCKVTDGLGNVGYSNNVGISIAAINIERFYY